MPDTIKERLEIIIEHADVIIERTEAISEPAGFKNDASGQLLLNSLLTRLQALAENIKKIKNLTLLSSPISFRLMLRPSYGSAILLHIITN